MAYATTAEVLALDGLNDPVFTIPMATEAITYATELIDYYTGTAWEYKAFSVVLDGNGRRDLDIGVLFPRTLTTVTVDGATQTTTGWALYPEGVLVRDTGWFAVSTVGRNVSVTGTAGATATPPEAIQWACRTIARQWMLDLVSRMPDRALSVTNDFGNVQIAQAGGDRRPTSLPEVNAVLNRHRHRPPGAR